MADVTAERTLWIIATIVIAAVVIFGVVYPWVTSYAASVDFQAVSYVVYDTGYCELKIRNLGSVAMTRLEISIADAQGNVYKPAKKWNAGAPASASATCVNFTSGLPAGDEVYIYCTDLKDRDGNPPASGTKLIITITATFANGKKVTHQYTAYVKSA